MLKREKANWVRSKWKYPGLVREIREAGQKWLQITYNLLSMMSSNWWTSEYNKSKYDRYTLDDKRYILQDISVFVYLNTEGDFRLLRVMIALNSRAMLILTTFLSFVNFKKLNIDFNKSYTSCKRIDQCIMHKQFVQHLNSEVFANIFHLQQSIHLGLIDFWCPIRLNLLHVLNRLHNQLHFQKN